MAEFTQKDAARALVRWYSEMGVDESVAPAPADFFAWGTPPEPAPPQSTPATPGKPAANNPAANNNDSAPTTAVFKGDTVMPADEAVARARTAAGACGTVEALAEAVMAFDAHPLKAGARNTVFADGVYGADLLVIGEAPGRDEDRIGKPFVGRAGQLLDKMLAAIGRSRATDTLISNVIYWRPPGNRTPTPAEIEICRPFVDRLIELTAPKAILLAGGAPMSALLGVSGIMRARGIWREVTIAGGARVPVLPTFHPAFLLRQPGQKRLAWSDLLSLQAKLMDG